MKDKELRKHSKHPFLKCWAHRDSFMFIVVAYYIRPYYRPGLYLPLVNENFLRKQINSNATRVLLTANITPHGDCMQIVRMNIHSRVHIRVTSQYTAVPAHKHVTHCGRLYSTSIITLPVRKASIITLRVRKGCVSKALWKKLDRVPSLLIHSCSDMRRD